MALESMNLKQKATAAWSKIYIPDQPAPLSAEGGTAEGGSPQGEALPDGGEVAPAAADGEAVAGEDEAAAGGGDAVEAEDGRESDEGQETESEEGYNPNKHPERGERAASRDPDDLSRPENMDMDAAFEVAGGSMLNGVSADEHQGEGEGGGTDANTHAQQDDVRGSSSDSPARCRSAASVNGASTGPDTGRMRDGEVSGSPRRLDATLDEVRLDKRPARMR